MILYNAKIYTNGLLRKRGAIIIKNGIITNVKYNLTKENLEELKKQNTDRKEIDCKNKVILPGIIDIHAHLRDINQSYKETFTTGTTAAAYSGITTVFNMPNTDPPAITSETVSEWIEKARENIFVNVGFISGVPNRLNENEIKKIIALGVIGFKIYPHYPICDLDWNNEGNFKLLLNLSSRYKKKIFIHPDWPLSNEEKREIYEDYMFRESNILKMHDKLHPCKSESRFVKFAIETYKDFVNMNNLKPEKYPSIHFCHISCEQSYTLIRSIIQECPDFQITYEITPHHLLLSNSLELKNPAIAKVMPPLRDKKHSEFLFNELELGNIILIGTDHAPHSMEEKSQDFFNAPSGFPGFETYPYVILDKVCRYKLSLDTFVKVACENPAKIFGLKGKGYIKEGFDADLLIADKISEYKIDATKFKSKAKHSPFDNHITHIQVWKVLINGEEISENAKPSGKIIMK